jgi:hypothetical protein
MDFIDALKRDCAALGMRPHQVLEAAGLHRSLWWRWCNGVSPTLRSMTAVQEVVRQLRERAQ